jgi:hypothetical protein
VNPIQELTDMASVPQQTLPLFYNQLQPLSSQLHGDWSLRQLPSAQFLSRAHAVPLTVEEFPMAQRHFPIVFSAGDEPVPLALMGLNEGVNVFVDDEGKLREDVYVPAYVRRYPFMLVRLRPETDELSLCFDPTAGAVGQFEDGQKLFENGEPSAATRELLGFCEQFEQAVQRTQAFMAELKAHDLLMEGELTIHAEGAEQPFVYRGFGMIAEDKLRELRGDVLRKMMQSGLLSLAFAHLLSLPLARDVFARQAQQGKAPKPELPPLG